MGAAQFEPTRNGPLEHLRWVTPLADLSHEVQVRFPVAFKWVLGAIRVAYVSEGI